MDNIDSMQQVNERLTIANDYNLGYLLEEEAIQLLTECGLSSRLSAILYLGLNKDQYEH